MATALPKNSSKKGRERAPSRDRSGNSDAQIFSEQKENYAIIWKEPNISELSAPYHKNFKDVMNHARYHLQAIEELRQLVENKPFLSEFTEGKKLLDDVGLLFNLHHKFLIDLNQVIKAGINTTSIHNAIASAFTRHRRANIIRWYHSMTDLCLTFGDTTSIDESLRHLGGMASAFGELVRESRIYQDKLDGVEIKEKVLRNWIAEANWILNVDKRKEKLHQLLEAIDSNSSIIHKEKICYKTDLLLSKERELLQIFKVSFRCLKSARMFKLVLFSDLIFFLYSSNKSLKFYSPYNICQTICLESAEIKKKMHSKYINITDGQISLDILPENDNSKIFYILEKAATKMKLNYAEEERRKQNRILGEVHKYEQNLRLYPQRDDILPDIINGIVKGTEKLEIFTRSVSEEIKHRSRKSYCGERKFKSILGHLKASLPKLESFSELTHGHASHCEQFYLSNYENSYLGKLNEIKRLEKEIEKKNLEFDNILKEEKELKLLRKEPKVMRKRRKESEEKMLCQQETLFYQEANIEKAFADFSNPRKLKIFGEMTFCDYLDMAAEDPDILEKLEKIS